MREIWEQSRKLGKYLGKSGNQTISLHTLTDREYGSEILYFGKLGGGGVSMLVKYTCLHTCTTGPSVLFSPYMVVCSPSLFTMMLM